MSDASLSINCSAHSGGMLTYSKVMTLVPKLCFFLCCWTWSTAWLRMDVISTGVATSLSSGPVNPKSPGDAGELTCLEGPDDSALPRPEPSWLLAMSEVVPWD